MIAGFIGGAIWGGIAGILKARAGANEVIVTIMLNYIAGGLLAWLLTTKAFQMPGRTDPIALLSTGTPRSRGWPDLSCTSDSSWPCCLPWAPGGCLIELLWASRSVRSDPIRMPRLPLV